MSDCCATILGEEFGERAAARQLRGYRRRGPARETALLTDALIRAGVDGATLLDIGGGVGGVQDALLRAGADRALSVDASSAFTAAARDLARERGYAGRVERVIGDFVDVADAVPAADVVVLDKVICCYPEMDRLVGLSADRSERLYGYVVPHDGRLHRLMVALANGVQRVRRSAFRAWAHPHTRIEWILHERGFRLRERADTFVWAIRVFER